jgi:hypothetical protein
VFMFVELIFQDGQDVYLYKLQFFALADFTLLIIFSMNLKQSRLNALDHLHKIHANKKNRQISVLIRKKYSLIV